jgi:hypothetical protein
MRMRAASCAQLKEFEEFRSPSFNVLYVQTPRPSFKSSPLLADLSEILGEAGEMLGGIFRLGIPQNSLRDKLPFFREDHSPLPNTVRPRVQKVLRSNIQYAESLAAASKEVGSYEGLAHRSVGYRCMGLFP